MTRSGRLLIVALALSAAAGVAQAGKTYKWLDSQGNVRYSDQPPPPGARILRESGDDRPALVEREKAPVTLYLAPRCDACDLVRHWLTQRRVPFQEVNAAADAEAQAELQKRFGQIGVPVLAVGDNYILGYNPIDFERVLTAAGHAVDLPEKAVTEEGTPPTR